MKYFKLIQRVDCGIDDVEWVKIDTSPVVNDLKVIAQKIKRHNPNAVQRIVMIEETTLVEID